MPETPEREPIEGLGPLPSSMEGEAPLPDVPEMPCPECGATDAWTLENRPVDGEGVFPYRVCGCGFESEL